MPEEKEFRIGDLQAGFVEPAPRSGGRVDEGLFPTLAAWLDLPSPARRERTDELAARARQETRPEVQTALQAAIRLLSEISLKDGGSQ
jgi:hypothetical protein